MNFGALSRGFGTCCLRFKNGVATTHAKLASGWLARLYREGVEPSGSLQKVSDHPSSFSGLGLAQGKFHRRLSVSRGSIRSPRWRGRLWRLCVRAARQAHCKVEPLPGSLVTVTSPRELTRNGKT
jgi:hypothetical protein